MRTEVINLWENNDEVKLYAYILNNSSQFQADVKKPAIIVCAGGGYGYTSDREAEPVALAYAAKGYHTFVLRYSVAEKALFPQPFLDLGKAIETVRKNADRWFLDKNKVSLVGFSAGGHLVCTMGSIWNSKLFKDEPNIDETLIKPNAIIAGYPPIDFYMIDRDSITIDVNKSLYYARCAADLSNPKINVSEVLYMTAFGKQLPTKEEIDMYNATVQMSNGNMPPTFVWCTTEDALVNTRQTMLLVEALGRNNVPYEVHIFQSGPHGLSLANEQTSNFDYQTVPHVAKWFELSIEWLKEVYINLK